MPVPTKRWRIATPISADQAAALGKYPAILKQIMHNRGIHDLVSANQYLAALPPPGSEPHNLLGLPAAVDRIRAALAKREKIIVYGDYDLDGVSAVALLVHFLESQGGVVSGYIPNRFDEGYGVNNEALDTLANEGTTLVITVDCGIRSPAEARHAQALGLDLIITDHHHPGEELPQALAVINPRQPGCTYPEKNLAGVGLAYKLVEALAARQGLPGSAAEEYLDLVALGTVTDLAPLSGENRSLVRRGLAALRSTRRQGLFSLINSVIEKPERLTSVDIGFILGPRLNAAGRLESALASLQLLLTREEHEAGELVQQLEVHNQKRQELTQTILERAEKIALEADPQALLIFAAAPEFNSGVVGLVASRLTERYHRPAIVAHQGETMTRGSCRSIPEFHITDALDECRDLMERHGGHAAAAGFTIRNENVAEMLRRLQVIAQARLGGLDLRPVLEADLEIALVQLEPKVLNELDLLQPTGHGNPQAVFVSRRVRVTDSRKVGRDSNHLKMKVSDDKITHDAIAFRMGELHGNLPLRVDIMYTFERNDYNPRSPYQLNIRDIKPSGQPDE
jgi:single-stranded-DNA-specific exonuclease